MKICIGNLGLYNEGHNLWSWLELPTSTEEIEETFVKIGLGAYNEAGEYIHGIEKGGSYYEEYHIVDWEEVPEGLTVERYSNIEELNEICFEYEMLSSYDKELVEAICENEGCDLMEAIEGKNDRIYFKVDTRQDESGQYYDLGKYYLEETGGLYGVPEHLKNYIDFESYGRDLGFTIASNGIATNDY